MTEWLFEDQREHPKIYDVMIGGKKERTVNIRIGISWPGAGIPGYFVVVAQLEQTDRDRNNKQNRYLAFGEGQDPLLNDLFSMIATICNKWRVDYICHGDETGEESFSFQLSDYLQKKKDRYEIIQIPDIGKSWRCKQPDFLVQLVRTFIASKNLIFFNIGEKRTPILIDKIKNTDMETNIVEVPEIKALAHVMDDFECSPWKPPKPKPEPKSPWVS